MLIVTEMTEQEETLKVYMRQEIGHSSSPLGSKQLWVYSL